MANIQDWDALAAPSQEWEDAVKNHLGGVKPDLGLFPDIPSMRATIAGMRKVREEQGLIPPQIPGAKTQDHQVTMRDGTEIVCRVYLPETPPANGSPLFVVYHGGGFCIGDLDYEDPLCRASASKFGAVCVNVDYRLAPEHRFPVSATDAIDAAKWAVKNAASLGADPSKGFLVGGTSAGGNLTAVVSHVFHDENITPRITGCVYMIPAFINHENLQGEDRQQHKSVEQNADAAILSRGAIDLFFDNYCPDHVKRGHPYFDVYHWKTGHGGQPPSTFQIAGADPLRDDSKLYERVLREKHGVPTKVEVYPGLPHGYHSTMPALESSRKFAADTLDCVQWLLEQPSK